MLGYLVGKAGDVKDDGLYSTSGASYNASSSLGGITYVLFGGKCRYGLCTLHLWSEGLQDHWWIIGATGNDQSGQSVSNAGDVNHDGIGYVIIGAPNSDPPEPTEWTLLTTSSSLVAAFHTLCTANWSCRMCIC